MAREADAGFSLIEALAALAVLAAASASLIGAAELHARRIGDVEVRAAARLVAGHALGLARLAGVRPDGAAQQIDMLGRIWRVGVAATPTGERDVVLAEVSAAPLGGGQGFLLEGFIDIGAPR